MWTPDDIEAHAASRGPTRSRPASEITFETRDQQVKDWTPELDGAAVAGLISSAGDEREAIVHWWDLDADERLVIGIEAGRTNDVLDAACAPFVMNWKAPLKEHALLPPEPTYEDTHGEPFPTIRGT